MVASNVAIVFSIAQSRRRRLIIPDSDAQLPPRIQAGEGMHVFPLATYQTPGFNPDAFLAAHLGKPPLHDHCGFYDNGGTVRAVLSADPTIDRLPGLTARLHPLVQHNDVWNGTAFTRRFAVFDPATRIVAQISMIDLDNQVSPVTGHQIIASPTLQVGDKVPA